MTFFLTIVTGFIIGLIIVGMGGSGAGIYLGVLISIFGLSASVAASTSLVTAFPALCIGAIGYWRQGGVQKKLALQMFLFALPSVIIGSLISPFIPANIYNLVIGGLLMYMGVAILLSMRVNKNGEVAKVSLIKTVFYAVLAGLMVGIGGLSGGGAIMSGLILMGLTMFEASGTSSTVLVGLSLIGIFFHIGSGQIDWSISLGMIMGSVIGAIISPILLNHIDQEKYTKIVKPIMGVLLFLMGIKTFFSILFK